MQIGHFNITTRNVSEKENCIFGIDYAVKVEVERVLINFNVPTCDVSEKKNGVAGIDHAVSVNVAPNAVKNS